MSKSQLNLEISCKSTVDKDGISPPLFSLNISFLPIDFTSCFGRAARNSFALSIMSSSGDFPETDEETQGCMLRIV